MPELLKASAEYIDSSYQPEKHKDYRLSIQLRLDGFSFAYFEPYSMSLLMLQDYRLSYNSNQNTQEKWQEINEYFVHHLDHFSIHKSNFAELIISIDHKEYSLACSALFKDQQQEEALLFNQSIPYSFHTLNTAMAGTERNLLFAIPKIIHSTLEDYFGDIKTIHCAGILENTIHKRHKNKKLGFQVYVNISNRDLHILVMENDHLLFHNAFSYTSKEDFIYFILLVYDQLHLNAEETPLTFMGDLSRSSAIFGITWQYIRNISFINQCEGIALNSSFDQMPIHQYFILLQSTLCES